MPQNFYELVWIFIIYAFIGWCTEVSYAALDRGIFVNRGFLNGPYCPIYGCGVVIVVAVLTPLKDNLLILFAGSLLLTSILEYITGFILEKVFHNKWWDYSNKPFNLHGYVCLKFSIYWGLACTFIMDVIHPIIYKGITMIPHILGVVLLSIVMAVFAVDCGVTVTTILKFNKRLKVMDEMAAKIHKLSDEIGENIYENVTTAVERSEEFQETHEELLTKISDKKENIKEIILKAVYDQKGMGAFNACIDDDAVEFLSDMSEGDARSALNAVELGVLSSEPEADGQIHITLSVAEECIQRRAFRYDKDGDNHYDIISAFIKSMRGSDPDAAVFYLAKMLCGGESITFIARRIMICACEDVGNADPNAICVATACAQAVERVGMPEAQIILAHAAIYVACAPKSNAIVNAIFSAKNVVEHEQTGQVPVYLRDAHYGGAKKLGHTGYKYAHDYPNHYVKQQYLPDEIADRQFYEPTDNGYEQNIKQYFKKIKEEL